MDRSWLYTKARSLRTMLFIVFPIVCIPEGNKMDFLFKKHRLQFHLISFLVAALTQNSVSSVSMRVTIEHWQRGLQEWRQMTNDMEFFFFFLQSKLFWAWRTQAGVPEHELLDWLRIAPVKGWGYSTVGRTLAWAWVPTPLWCMQGISVQKKLPSRADGRVKMARPPLKETQENTHPIVWCPTSKAIFQLTSSPGIWHPGNHCHQSGNRARQEVLILVPGGSLLIHARNRKQACLPCLPSPPSTMHWHGRLRQANPIFSYMI